MTLTVNILQRHIDEGERHSCTRCPIAQALNEQMPGDALWRVSGIGARRLDQYRPIDLPHTALRFAADFDRERDVQPFSFTITLPEDTNG
jgi:hypothetical protein